MLIEICSSPPTNKLYCAFRSLENNQELIEKSHIEERIPSSFVRQTLSDLPKRESSMSICSSTSIESDWSDEELEEVR